jgi:CRP-like cAMP-binding protein
MTVEERVEELRRIDLLRAVSDERMLRLAEHAEDRTYEAGDVVFREGDMPEVFFFLLDGRLETTSRMEDGV